MLALVAACTPTGSSEVLIPGRRTYNFQTAHSPHIMTYACATTGSEADSLAQAQRAHSCADTGLHQAVLGLARSLEAGITSGGSPRNTLISFQTGTNAQIATLTDETERRFGCLIAGATRH